MSQAGVVGQQLGYGFLVELNRQVPAGHQRNSELQASALAHGHLFFVAHLVVALVTNDARSREQRLLGSRGVTFRIELSKAEGKYHVRLGGDASGRCLKVPASAGLEGQTDLFEAMAAEIQQYLDPDKFK